MMKVLIAAGTADASVAPLVTSTRDNCLGQDCPRFRDCFVVKARREAMAADLVVVNTCAFVEEARQESIDTVQALSDDRADGASVVVTGCMAERYGVNTQGWQERVRAEMEADTYRYLYSQGKAGWDALQSTGAWSTITARLGALAAARQF